jgi:predicted GNAT family acetyltransferase
MSEAKLITFSTLGEFLRHNRRFIYDHYYQHFYLINIIEQVSSGELHAFRGYNIENEKGMMLFALHIEGFYLLYSFGWDNEMLALLSEQVDLKICTERFSFNGNRDLIQALFKKQNSPYEVFKERKIYKCESLNQLEAKVPGRLELCTFRDFKHLTNMAYQYHLEEYGGNAFRDLKSVSSLVEKGIRAGTFYLWRDGKQICCMAQVFNEDTGYPFIGGLFTSKEQRGKGYATAFVHGLTQDLFEDGFELAGLVSDVSNEASNKVFRKVGYIDIYDYVSLHTLNP